MIRILLTIFLIITFTSNSYSKEEITRYEDIVERGKLLYKKFTNFHFSGKIEGFFIDNFLGKLNTFSRGYIENGKRNGDWENYFSNGLLKSTGQMLNNVEFGEWKFYKKNGDFIGTGNYDKRGHLVSGHHVVYTVNNVLDRIERYKTEFEKEGLQEYFFRDEKGKLKYSYSIYNNKNMDILKYIVM